jgi:hypothetical protein
MQRRLLTLSVYENLGDKERNGLAVAVVKMADATMAELSGQQQAIARRIFLRLVQLGRAE